jgi:hypothetical protein
MDLRFHNATRAEIQGAFTGPTVRVAWDTGPFIRVSLLRLLEISLLTCFTVVPFVRVTGQTISDTHNLTTSVL